MMNRFISFEGIDGSGKTTQINLLKTELLKTHQKVVTFREPGGTDISESIREILLSKENSKLTDIAESFLFFASRSQLLAEKIIPSIEKGFFVLCDRFNDSTIAYQGYGKNLDKVKDLNFISNYSTKSLVPDLTFFLDVPAKLSIERREMSENDRIESKGFKYLEKVRLGFLEIADSNPNRFVVIDGSMNQEDIFKEIWRIVIDKYKIN